MLNAQVAADYFTFLSAPVNPLAPVPNPTRNDFLLSISAGPTFTVTSWFDIGASYTFSLRTSTVPQNNFPRHEAMLRLAFHY